MKSARRVLILLVGTLLATVAGDRVVGALGAAARQPGLLYPPHRVVEYRTPEFHYTVQTNGLGFRDREFTIGKSAGWRVAAIGDSFTYGWGVDLEACWPKALERELRQQGLDVEIANLGSPGAGPAKYAEIVEKAIPLLRPDLVVIATLQGDDLAQARPREPRRQGRLEHTVGLVHLFYPNLVAALAKRRGTTISSAMLRTKWKLQARAIAFDLVADEKKRFDRLDRRVREAFLAGDLNPQHVATALRDPDFYLWTLDGRDPSREVAIAEMARQFQRIKRLVEEHGARAIVVSVPHGPYASEHQLEASARLGFAVDPRMLVSDSPDTAIRRAAEAAGLPFFEVTQPFRLESRRSRLYFELDGHFNANGHRTYVALLGPILAREIARLSRAVERVPG